MKRFYLLLLAALPFLSSCNNQPKIEDWEVFSNFGAPFMKQPSHFIEVDGPYVTSYDDDQDLGVLFSFETENHAQSREYVVKCIKSMEKYADDLYEYPRRISKLTPEKLQEHAVSKGDIQLEGSQWGGGYHYMRIYSKDGQYYHFGAGYEVYNNHKRATGYIEIHPLGI